MDIRQQGNIAWDHLMMRNYAEALAIYESFDKNEFNIGDWNNYGITLLCIGEYSHAEEAFRQTRTLSYPQGITNSDVGAALWLQGKYTAACEDWESEIARILDSKMKRTNPASLYFVGLLWWASRRLNDEALWTRTSKSLKTILKLKSQYSEWGCAVVSYATDRITLDQFLFAAVRYAVREIAFLGTEGKRRGSQAYFYIAGKYDVDAPERYENLTFCKKYGSTAAISTPEYHIAKYELDLRGA